MFEIVKPELLVAAVLNGLTKSDDASNLAEFAFPVFRFVGCLNQPKRLSIRVDTALKSASLNCLLSTVDQIGPMLLDIYSLEVQLYHWRKFGGAAWSKHSRGEAGGMHAR